MSKDKCCGNCKHFTNEDVNGYGWCAHYLVRTTCGSGVCKAYEIPNNGWTEITPDNSYELKQVEEKRIVIANKHNRSTFYRCLHDINGLDSMAKQGGYYYYVLPELKIE